MELGLPRSLVFRHPFPGQSVSIPRQGLQPTPISRSRAGYKSAVSDRSIHQRRLSLHQYCLISPHVLWQKVSPSLPPPSPSPPSLPPSLPPSPSLPLPLSLPPSLPLPLSLPPSLPASYLPPSLPPSPTASYLPPTISLPIYSSDPLPGAVGQLLERATSTEERQFLSRVTASLPLSATLLPIYSVGVQVRVQR